MRKGYSNLTEEQRAELAALEALPDDQIDTTDIPEVLDWSNAKRGAYYRPLKQQITLRLDADIVAWFKARAPDGRGYQTDINRALREYVERTHHEVTILSNWGQCRALDWFDGDSPGEWVFSGTSVPVRTLIELLTDAESLQKYFDRHPDLDRSNVVEVLDLQRRFLEAASVIPSGRVPAEDQG
jgi:uncharacterized protein (DUF4415 family)/uncharacterized protein (DUF433 family)